RSTYHSDSFTSLFSQCSRHHPDLHSFPARRSSDLRAPHADIVERRLIKVDRREQVPDPWAFLDSDLVAERFHDIVARLRREAARSEEHTSELQSRGHLVCRLLLEKKKKKQ